MQRKNDAPKLIEGGISKDETFAYTIVDVKDRNVGSRDIKRTSLKKTEKNTSRLTTQLFFHTRP